MVGEEIPQMQLPSSRLSIVPSGTSKEVAAVEVEMRLVWICCGILTLTGCGQQTDYQPTANDLDKMSRMEAVNSQGDGVWDDTNYQWEIQDLL